jgi:hypothetical protein
MTEAIRAFNWRLMWALPAGVMLAGLGGQILTLSDFRWIN